MREGVLGKQQVDSAMEAILWHLSHFVLEKTDVHFVTHFEVTGNTPGYHRPGVGTTVLSGAVCSEDDDDDETNSKSHCQQLSSHIVPFQNMNMFYFSGFFSVHDKFSCGSSEVAWRRGSLFWRVLVIIGL